MAFADNLGWNLRRYLLRRDLLRKVRGRYERYRRRAERTAFDDVAHLLRDLPAPTVVFDVGANIGLVTSTLRKRFPAATVHAFEPTDDTMAVLRRRLAGDPHVVPRQVAVSDTVGTASFHVDNRTHAGGSNSLLEHSANFATRASTTGYVEVEVPTTTLDRYCADEGISHVDIVKLDIEGAELLALEGARSLLADQAIDVIVTEVRYVGDYVGQPLFWDVVAHLSGFGYTPFNTYAPAESEVRQALWADAVFVSEALRRRLQAAYGEHACGWHQDAGATG
jgi:FkbM family methyltransferase